MLPRHQRTCLNRNSWSVLRTQSSLLGDIYIQSSPFEGGLTPPFFFTFYLFPRAAGTDHHTFSSKQLAHSSESQKSEKGLPGQYQGIGRAVFLSGRAGEESIPGHFQRLPAFPGLCPHSSLHLQGQQQSIFQAL